ncbi:MAG: hypothetical protein H6564_19830 [Lewinellaceae bacterium]|nr:hypothetical protein [Lewinellaceae bacterium]
MGKFFKRLAIMFFLFLVLIIGAAALATSLFEKQVGQLIIKEVNKQLTTELIVKGFKLSAIRTFPNVAANLQGVTLMDSRGGALLETRELSFRFGLLSLFGSKIKVHSVVISDGGLNIEIGRDGKANYDIFREAPDETDDETSATISLEQARLRNIELSYSDKSTEQEASILVEDATFSGEFSSEQFSLKSQASLLSHYVNLDGLRYLANKSVGYDALIAVNLKEGTYKLDNVLLNVEDSAFKVDGSIENWESGTYFDLYASSDNGKLEGVFSLLPAEYFKGLEDFTSTGNFAFNALVKGQYNKKQSPEVRVEFGLEDGRLSSPKLAGPLKDVSFNAVFSNGKYRDNSSSSFTLENFKGYFNRELVEMRLQVSDFDNPKIDFYLDGVLPMSSAYGLLGNPKITGGEGEVEIKNLHLKGAYDDMRDPARIARVQAGGELEFDDAGLSIDEEKLVLDRGLLKLEGNRLSVENLRLEGAGSDVTFHGAAYNLIPVLFADSLNSRRVELVFEASLSASQLDIDRLMQFSALSPEEEQAPEPVVDSLRTAQIQQRQLVTSFLKGTFNADFERFNYNLIEGQSFTGKLDFDNNTMAVKGEVEAMGGHISLDGLTTFDGRPQLKAKLTAQHVEASEFFRQSENFGQDVLTDQQLKGTLDARIAIYAFWDEEGNFLMDKLRVLAGIGITNGELAGMKMLESFSTFVNIKDLQHIKFVDMQNFLEVRNQRIYLPAMFIRSNALNLTISGEHSFDNELNYNIKVNAGQVLADRFKRHDPGLQPKATRRNGWFNLYYRIFGTLDDYKIQSAKRRVKSEFELSEIRKRDIQRALEAEFGPVKLIQEPADWEDADGGNTPAGEEEYLDFDLEGGR